MESFSSFALKVSISHTICQELLLFMIHRPKTHHLREPGDVTTLISSTFTTKKKYPLYSKKNVIQARDFDIE